MTLLQRELHQAGVGKVVQWATPSWKAHEALLALALYEKHAQWHLDMVAWEWKRQAGAPNGGATPLA